MQLEMAREVHRARYGTGRLKTLTREGRIVSDAAWSTLRGYVRHRMPDGTVLLPDSLGRWSALRPLDSEEIIARAYPDGLGEISVGLCQALDGGSRGLWCDPRFFRSIGDTTGFDLPPVESGVPLGLERMERWRLDALERTALEARVLWLENAFDRLCSDRMTCLYLTRQAALEWLWGHEIGHLLGGHPLLADMSSDLWLGRGGGEGEPAGTRPGPALGLELLADDVAGALLLRREENANGTIVDLAVMGAILALSLFEARLVVSRLDHETVTHPGSWLRTRALLNHADLVAGGEGRRLRCVMELASAMGQCGNWLGSAIDPNCATIADQFRADAFSDLAPLADGLERLRAAPVCDPADISRDLLDLIA